MIAIRNELSSGKDLSEAELKKFHSDILKVLEALPKELSSDDVQAILEALHLSHKLDEYELRYITAPKAVEKRFEIDENGGPEQNNQTSPDDVDNIGSF